MRGTQAASPNDSGFCTGALWCTGSAFTNQSLSKHCLSCGHTCTKYLPPSSVDERGVTGILRPNKWDLSGAVCGSSGVHC